MKFNFPLMIGGRKNGEKFSNKMNEWRYAVAYCEAHECTDCYIYKNNLDTRTREEWLSYTPCSKNIHDYLEKHNMDELPE